MIFNSTEREGVLVMLLLITGLIVIPRFVRSGKPAFFLLPEVINIEKDQIPTEIGRFLCRPAAERVKDESLQCRFVRWGIYRRSFKDREIQVGHHEF